MLAQLLALFLIQADPEPGPEPQPMAPEPELPAAALVEPGTELSGPDWRVQTPVPVRGFLGQFVIESRWGPIPAQGRELLTLRIAELAALEQLDALSSTRVFAGAIADSAMATGRAVTRVVTNPVETAKGIPAGLGRLIGRTAASARKLAVAAGDAVQRQADASSDGDSDGNTIQPKDFANELAGVNRARRGLARRLGIDPYTGNPLIQERLEKLAWASVAGGMSMDLMLGQVGGVLSDAISMSRKLDGLVWDLPPDDIRRRLEAKLVERGAEPLAAREFLRNPAFTPTLQVEFVSALEGLGRPDGEPEVLLLARTIRSEVHARFLIQQLRMLARHVPGDDPVSELLPFEASIGARSESGELWIALPVDFLPNNDETDLVAADKDAPPSHLVIAGGVSEQARRELEDAGWIVRADVGLAAAQPPSAP